MGRGLAVIAAMACAGCAATASQTHSREGSPSTVWKVHGHQSPFGKVTITINGQTAMQGKVSIWSGEGRLTGTYDGQPAVAECSKDRGSQARTSCRIFVGAEPITTLHFRI